MYDEGLLKISLHYKTNLKEDGEHHKRIGWMTFKKKKTSNER